MSINKHRRTINKSSVLKKSRFVISANNPTQSELQACSNTTRIPVQIHTTIPDLFFFHTERRKQTSGLSFKFCQDKNPDLSSSVPRVYEPGGGGRAGRELKIGERTAVWLGNWNFKGGTFALEVRSISIYNIIIYKRYIYCDQSLPWRRWVCLIILWVPDEIVVKKLSKK